ncbi:response regulator [Patescibacteria group bacterium]|nr:response regulator [Patescibacteria group bacterium]MBU1868445.1 response regulator [Patescibacteria group bacterium]
MPSINKEEFKILLVEDDTFVKDLYVRTLTKRGYQVLIAEDGEAGLEVLRENLDKVGLVLLDIMMPKKNGIDALKDMAAEGMTEKTTVVLLTNLGQESIIKEAFNIGAKGYMLKARLLPREIADQIDEFFETGVFPANDRNGL